MKFRKLVPLALLAFFFSALTFTSCKKEETPPNNGGGGNGGGGGGNNNTDWNWTGTAPFSVKLSNGATYTHDTAVVQNASGIYGMIASGTDNMVSITFPNTATANTIYEFPGSLGTVGFATTGKSYSGTTSKIKIISISGTEVEGKFYGTAKEVSTSETIELKEGYFKVKL